jgi:hypothetical protein
MTPADVLIIYLSISACVCGLFSISAPLREMVGIGGDST